MDDHRFFKFVWRFNGLVLMVALSGVIVITLYNVVKELLHTRPPNVIRNVADDPSGEEKWRLGYPQQIDGTSFVYIPLISEQEDIKLRDVRHKGSLDSYSGEAYSDPTRNILFVNMEKNEMKWLFPTNNQLVTQVRLLPETAYNDKKRRIEAILYQVVKKDTDGNKRLTVDDDTVIAFSLPDGSKYKDVLSSADRLIDAMLLENRMLFLMYQTKGVGYSSTLRLDDFATVKKVELPKVPN